MGGDLIVIDQLMMNSCVASGVLFSFVFFPSQFFLTEAFWRGFFPMGVLATCPK